MHLIHWVLFGDESAKVECLKGFQLANGGLPHRQDQAKLPTIEYSSNEVESVGTHLVVFAKHSSEYMVRHG